MDNGLRGRYLEQLEAWNNARQLAAEIVAAYGSSNRTIGHVLDEWGFQGIGSAIPSISQIKKLMSEVVFLDGHSTIDKLARNIMDWQEWESIEPPTVDSSSAVAV
jgi:hypothetical protein